jgi:hypothetical protein
MIFALEDLKPAMVVFINYGANKVWIFDNLAIVRRFITFHEALSSTAEFIARRHTDIGIILLVVYDDCSRVICRNGNLYILLAFDDWITPVIDSFCACWIEHSLLIGLYNTSNSQNILRPPYAVTPRSIFRGTNLSLLPILAIILIISLANTSQTSATRSITDRNSNT